MIAKNKDNLDHIFEDYDIDPAFTEMREHSHCLVRDIGAPKRPEVMFVGEAPGRAEDRTGLPFTGANGRLLGELLESIGLSREQVYITNVVKYRPVDVSENANRQPYPHEVQASLLYLRRELRIVRPRCLVTLGSFALRALLPDAPPVSVAHGHRYKTPYGRPVIALYHPAVALYNPRARPVLFADFRAIKQVLQELVDK